MVFFSFQQNKKILNVSEKTMCFTFKALVNKNANTRIAFLFGDAFFHEMKKVP